MHLASSTLTAALAAFLLSACERTPQASATEDGRSGSAARPAARDSILPLADRGRIQGADTASLWVIEVSDFQCPFCAQWHGLAYEQLRREFVETGQVRFAYINYPIPSHRHAWPASMVAMCAAAQGKFWAVHSAIFETQDSWVGLADATPFFDSLAVAHGAAAEPLRECVRTEAVRPLIQGDMDRAIEARINATPYFIIGESRLSGLQPIDNLRRAIRAEQQRRAAQPTPGS